MSTDLITHLEEVKEGSQELDMSNTFVLSVRDSNPPAFIYSNEKRYISKFRGEYRFLSNFYSSPIRCGNKIFPTAEHFYQSRKCKNIDDIVKFTNPNLTPGQAKRLGRKIMVKDTWLTDRLLEMTFVICNKFKQNPNLSDKLKATKGIILVEGNDWNDTFWGVCRGYGHNHLGRILMVYRDYYT